MRRGWHFRKKSPFFRGVFHVFEASVSVRALNELGVPENKTTDPQLSIACRDIIRLPVTKKLEWFKVGGKIPKMTPKSARVLPQMATQGESPKIH